MSSILLAGTMKNRKFCATKTHVPKFAHTLTAKYLWVDDTERLQRCTKLSFPRNTNFRNLPASNVDSAKLKGIHAGAVLKYIRANRLEMYKRRLYKKAERSIIYKYFPSKENGNYTRFPRNRLYCCRITFRLGIIE